MTKDAVNPLSRHVRHRLRGTCASDPTLPQLGLAVEQQSPRPEDLESDEAGQEVPWERIIRYGIEIRRGAVIAWAAESPCETNLLI
jgi:hypothetical protein